MLTITVTGLPEMKKALVTELQDALEQAAEKAQKKDVPWRIGKTFCSLPAEQNRRDLGKDILVRIEGIGPDKGNAAVPEEVRNDLADSIRAVVETSQPQADVHVVVLWTNHQGYSATSTKHSSHIFHGKGGATEHGEPARA